MNVQKTRTNRFKTPRPIVKWVGGKGQITNTLLELAPKTFEQYWEPFCGGGAFFFELIRAGRISAACLSDLNQQLMITVATVAERVSKVTMLLQSEIFENTETNYYAVRSWDRESEWSDIVNDREYWPFVAARVIFLTKLAFNGLWRENKKGQHNAPYCKAPEKNIVDPTNLSAVSKSLKGIVIGKANFEFLMWGNWQYLAEMCNPVCPTDFVYFDPPYPTSFTDYTADGFNMEELTKVRQMMDELTCLGTYVMLSMKDTPEVRKLFQGYLIVSITTDCRINSDATKRKNGMNELIILNYDPETSEVFDYEQVQPKRRKKT